MLVLGRAREMIADLALLAEALDAHIDETTSFRDMVNAQQMAFSARLDGLELQVAKTEGKVEVLGQRADITAEEVAVLWEAIRILQQQIIKLQTKPKASSPVSTSRPPVMPEVNAPYRIPGDTLPASERANIFTATGR